MSCGRAIQTQLFATVTAILLASSAASGQTWPAVSLEVHPPDPGPSDPVTVVLTTTVDPCWTPGCVTSNVGAGGDIQIDWFIGDFAWDNPNPICPDVEPFEWSEEVAIGILPSGDYTVTNRAFLGPYPLACGEGEPGDPTSISFTVAGPDVPAASAWGLGAFTLLLLVAGTLQVRRHRIRSNPILRM